MNKVEIDEKIEDSPNSFVHEDLFEYQFPNNHLAHVQSEIALEKPLIYQNEEFLDKCLAAIKLVFLYIPGTMAINMVGMFAYTLILYGEEFPNFYWELSGFALVGTFLTMLGIGKLKDLSYLKVPAAVFASSVLFSIIHALISIFIGNEAFGFFFLSSFPIVAFVGYFVKRMLDKNQ